jgi:hypothetical protein
MNTSADARVIASFVFIVALLLGAWAPLDNVITALVPVEFGRLAIALMPFAATAVAFQAGNATKVAWARALGGAAVMLGVLASLGGVLYFLANT